MGKQRPSFDRPECSDNSAPICGSDCCITETLDGKRAKDDVDPSSRHLREQQSDIQELVVIGVGPHGHALLLISLPSNLKNVLSSLPVKDQVVLYTYIAGLRDQLKEYKAQADVEDVEPCCLDEKCTSEHGRQRKRSADQKDKNDSLGAGEDED
eukprot:CAMPEP_0201867570 /NCGR_PEP_ID=MMETSP0902-20130614/1759_1 /ASSEMBLY_ACC=CAM_ASM_000551 /TAXON_ID=420261 /ORGANISM="Thalassiosira antarctica, Strain CCMP982" /LENGTH=153 /DNA_ID=CAMNT_0048392749 /DNA_START=67 /DNA_END=528 /DNA_ORIENTATION=+